MTLQIKWAMGAEGPEIMELDEGATIGDIKQQVPGRFVFMINGLNRPDSYVIQPDDKIMVMPILEGG